MSANKKRELISPGYLEMSVSKKIQLLGLQRSSFYFKPKGESFLNIHLMELNDKKHLLCSKY